jgi:hypothetical protein
MADGTTNPSNSDTKADKAIPAMLDALEIARAGTYKTNKLRRIAYELKLKREALEINSDDSQAYAVWM